MSTKTSQRRLARRQRQHLKDGGWPEREIQAFAQIFQTTPDEPTDPRFTCATDEEADR